ncbi:MAG: long-chain-fatty-acid--CoA ligase [Sporichthyaceae bacterium]
MNLAQNLVDTASTGGERVALRFGDDTLTYAQLLERAKACAGMIRGLGIAPGERIGLIAPNVPAFPIVYYGALLAGCGVVPMNPLLTEREVTYYLRDSGAAAVIAVDSVVTAATPAAAGVGIPLVVVAGTGPSPEQAPANGALESAEPRSGSDLAVILYTSGTTGQPKGAVLTHHNLDSNARTTRDTLLASESEDVVMGCLPLFHVFGLTCGMNAAVIAGSSLVLIPRFDPEAVLALIAEHQVTIFEGVPTMYAAMLGVPTEYDTSSLRTCVSGGAAIPVEVMKSFEARYGCQILEGYGLSETSPVACFNPRVGQRKPGSIGVAVRGMELRLVDNDGNDTPVGEIGEIAIRGEGVMAGYHNRPEATAEAIPDGWFRSGDLAKQDDDGYFYIVDRKKQLIIRGGYNVYPREVEEVLYAFPGIAEAAVIGLKHTMLGEEVGAAVVMKAGESFDPAAIKAFCKEGLAAYKYPRHIWAVDVLPKGPTGKILHREVVAPAEVVVE